jgi:Tfp pilus assembly protein PilO
MKFFIATIMLVAGIAAIAIVGVPKYGDVQTLRAEQASLDTALDNARKLRASQQEILDRYNSFSREDRERLSSMLPDNIDNVKLIIELDALASQYGLPLQNVTVSDTEEDSDVQVINEGSSEYGEVQLQFSVRGRYEQFVQFMEQLERSLRLIDVKDLSFQSTSEVGVYQYSMTIATYWLQ